MMIKNKLIYKNNLIKIKKQKKNCNLKLNYYL